jgi:UDP:flavonoid glycosyltransferase YjiC (YdhE family)
LVGEQVRILVTTNAAIGHFLPMASTIAELVAGGHEVRIGCPGTFEPFLRKAGFDALPCEEIEVSPQVPPVPPADDRAGRLIWAVTCSWPSDCRPWVDELLRQTQQWRPDLVMVEPVEHAGRIVAAALGVPLVVHGWGFTLPAFVEELAPSGILDVYERVSATPQLPALITDLGPASVQAADIGPVQRYGYRPFPVPGQPLPPLRTEKLRVLVTLGTYANVGAASQIRAAVSAALDNGAEVIAVLGHDDRGSRETFPPNATVLEWVDMPAAIAGCDLVVHHGGAGTSWTALSCGKPAVVLPQGGDQFRNAEILSAAGAALVCSSREIGDVAAAIACGLDDSKLTERAAMIARENAELPDVAELARHISTLEAGQLRRP